MKKLIAIVAILLFVAAWYITAAALLVLVYNLFAGVVGLYAITFWQALFIELLATLVAFVLSVSMRG